LRIGVDRQQQVAAGPQSLSGYALTAAYKRATNVAAGPQSLSGYAGWWGIALICNDEIHHPA
ncbi:hypothetical protein, partial [Sphingomonas sp. S17]|uniref:hypothetical protein n=1 Tax=Sphingomonas sp. S17 TaxID=1007104 RepID=UPI001ED94FB2